MNIQKSVSETFLQVCLTSLMVLASAHFYGCQADPADDRHSADRPNIIYIIADDLGYGDLGSYGQPIIHTPNLDRMADEGIRFTQHYSGSTVCAPARCSLMTGRHGGHAVIRNNFEVGSWDSHLGQYPLPASEVTIAERSTRSVLAKAGIKVETVSDLLDKLRNEAKVLS